jgi:hypothetical protein
MRCTLKKIYCFLERKKIMKEQKKNIHANKQTQSEIVQYIRLKLSVMKMISITCIWSVFFFYLIIMNVDCVSVNYRISSCYWRKKTIYGFLFFSIFNYAERLLFLLAEFSELPVLCQTCHDRVCNELSINAENIVHITFATFFLTISVVFFFYTANIAQ